jgi:hypothetical protein
MPTCQGECGLEVKLDVVEHLPGWEGGYEGMNRQFMTLEGIVD